VYPYDEDPPTTVLDPAPTQVLGDRHGHRLRRLLGARALVVMAVIGAVALVAAATTAAVIALDDSGQHVTARQAIQQPATQTPAAQEPTVQPPDGPGAGPALPGKGDPAAREAWVRQNGQDRSAMPNLPDVASASRQQQAAATDLLAQTQASAAAYGDTAKAQAAGFDLQAALSNAENAQPRLAQRLARIDAGHAEANPPLLHVVNKANTHDGKVLKPTAPEMLLYQYRGHNTWQLIGAVFTANESFPQPPPDPGGPITRWSYDGKHPATLSMTVFFTAGSDLAQAYALTPPKA
jgi:hypothetical protein